MSDERRLAVLRAIVEDYVHTREPVGSKALVERRMGADFDYRWTITAEHDDAAPKKFLELMQNTARFDPDCWLIELDVADAERFIAETIALP